MDNEPLVSIAEQLESVCRRERFVLIQNDPLLEIYDMINNMHGHAHVQEVDKDGLLILGRFSPGQK